MKHQKLVRVAFVRYRPNGNAYATRCDRTDIIAGHEVEVSMVDELGRTHYVDGVIDRIEFHKWNCRHQVDCLKSEVEYTASLDEMEIDRKVSLAIIPSAENNSERQIHYYNENRSFSSRGDMQDIYDAVSSGDGEDTYLSDGMWIRSDGSIYEN